MANEIVKYEQVKDKIFVLRGEPVLLDADVAQLYGVETRVVNQAVKNNPDKFPEGFLIPLTLSEKKEVIKNFDHLESLKFSPVNPTAFTESGLYMLATILKSPRATQTTLAIIRTFVQIRELARTMQSVGQAEDEALVGDGREVAHADHALFLIGAGAQESNRAAPGVVHVQPLEALPGAVHLIHGGI